MVLKIVWTVFAKSELKDIFEYYKNKVSYRVAKNLVNGIYDRTLILEEHPETGQIEDLLKGKEEGFRYLIYKSYKIIYWIDYSKNKIEISDVFDTRQNPSKIDRY